ncbi:MAG: hypothetical protein QW067_10230 [Thermofilaceae archaeon]
MPPRTCSYVANKHIGLQNPRTPVVAARKAGALEQLVLSYAVTVSEVFSPSDIVVYYNLKDIYGENARRRVHDAVSRLVKRGYLTKEARGLYRLAVDLAPKTVAKLKQKTREPNTGEDKDILSGVPVAVPVAGSSGGGGVFLLRFHVRPGDDGLEAFYVRLLVVKFVVDYSVRVVEGYLSRVFSRSWVRGVRSRVSRSVRVFGSVVGCHGGYGRRSAGLLPLHYGFKGLDLRQKAFVYELGLDLVAEVPVPADRLFAKVYSRRLEGSLLEYASRVASGVLQSPPASPGLLAYASPRAR